jgi:hypothetical protein
MSRPRNPFAYCRGCDQAYQLQFTEPEPSTILAIDNNNNNNNNNSNEENNHKHGNGKDSDKVPPAPRYPTMCKRCGYNTCQACLVHQWKSIDRSTSLLPLERFDIPCMLCHAPDGYSATCPMINVELMLVLQMIMELATSLEDTATHTTITRKRVCKTKKQRHKSQHTQPVSQEGVGNVATDQMIRGTGTESTAVMSPAAVTIDSPTPVINPLAPTDTTYLLNDDDSNNHHKEDIDLESLPDALDPCLYQSDEDSTWSQCWKEASNKAPSLGMDHFNNEPPLDILMHTYDGPAEEEDDWSLLDFSIQEKPIMATTTTNTNTAIETCRPRGKILGPQCRKIPHTLTPDPLRRSRRLMGRIKSKCTFESFLGVPIYKVSIFTLIVAVITIFDFTVTVTFTRDGYWLIERNSIRAGYLTYFFVFLL